MSASDLECQTKIIRYLMRHPSGVSAPQITAWLDSCRKDGGFTIQQMNDAKLALRDQGRIACTNGTWWLKDLTTAQREVADERRQLQSKRREQSRARSSGGH